MSFALYGHPFSSYAQKVLIALHENGTLFESRCLGPDTPQHATVWLKRPGVCRSARRYAANDRENSATDRQRADFVNGCHEVLVEGGLLQ